MDVFPAIQALADAGVDFGLIVEGVGDVLRAQLTCTLGGTPVDVSERMRAALIERTSRVTSADLLRMLHALLELEPIFRRSGQPQLLIETFLVRCALLDRTVDIEDVLRGFGDGGRDDPPRRVAHEARVVSAHALSPATLTSPAAVVAPARLASTHPVVPVPRSATQQVADAAAAAQRADATSHSAVPAVRGPSGASAPPSLPAVQAGWQHIIEAVRKAGRAMVAESLQRMTPIEVTTDGGVLLGYAPTDDTFVRAVESARADVLAAMQGCVEGVVSFALRRRSDGADQPARNTTRLTQAAVHQQRVQQLSARDPVLEAAVRVLDLELLD